MQQLMARVGCFAVTMLTLLMGSFFTLSTLQFADLSSAAMSTTVELLGSGATWEGFFVPDKLIVLPVMAAAWIDRRVVAPLTAALAFVALLLGFVGIASDPERSDLMRRYPDAVLLAWDAALVCIIWVGLEAFLGPPRAWAMLRSVSSSSSWRPLWYKATWVGLNVVLLSINVYVAGCIVSKNAVLASDGVSQRLQATGVDATLAWRALTWSMILAAVPVALLQMQWALDFARRGGAWWWRSGLALMVLIGLSIIDVSSVSLGWSSLLILATLA